MIAGASKRFVGGDAHIAPLGNYEFALVFHKNGSFRRGDVGIAPYEHPGKRAEIQKMQKEETVSRLFSSCYSSSAAAVPR